MPYTSTVSAQNVILLPKAEYDVMLLLIGSQEAQLASLAAEVARLKKIIADGTPPVSKALILTKTRISNLAGVTLENGDSEPNAAQYTLMRTALTQASQMGFNAVRFFLNPYEVQTHNALSPVTSPSHLPNFARSLGLAYIADTVDGVVWDTFEIEDNPLKSTVQKALATANLKTYLLGLAKLGALAFVCNDANQYREKKNPDGTPVFPVGTLERIVARIRAICPQMPLIASVTGNAVIAEYKPLFDFLEAQTFGKAAELPVFLGKLYDVFCLDGRAKVVTPTYLRAMHTAVLAANPDAFFVYPDTVTDWQESDMQENVGIIAGMIKAWWIGR